MSDDDKLIVFSICSLLSREEFGAEVIKRAVELRSFDDVYKKFWTASRRLEEMRQLGRSCIAEIGKVFNPASVTQPIEAVRIRKIQTALEKLGFYTRAIDGIFGPSTRAAVTAYRRSFDFPGGDGLSDAELSSLERIARSGFRDGNELRRAEAAGFTSRSEYLAALVGGFRDARSYKEAQDAGFRRRDDWERFLASRALVDADAAQKRSGDEEEIVRIALETARGEAERLSAALEAFARSGGVLEDGLEIARAVVVMRKLEKSDATEPLEQAINALDTLLSKERAYNAFLVEEAKAADLAQSKALAEAIGATRRFEAFIRSFLARNVLAPEAPKLIALQGRLAEALEANSSETIVLAQEEAIRALEELGLEDQARAFVLDMGTVPEPPHAEATTLVEVETANARFAPVPRPNALAVVIGNRNYSEAPEVRFAHNDASAFARFFTDVMGLEPRKVIHETHLTSLGMARLFGRPGGPDGRLQRLARFVDEVYVFYSGHGVPELRQGGAARGYILPVDIPPGTPGFGAYALDDLISQLQELPVSRVTVFIDACFSGLSEGGSLVANVSGAFGVAVAAPTRRARVSVLAATAFDEPQLAHWLPEHRHGAFTFHALTGLHGAADRMGDRRVTLTALQSFIDEGLAFGGFDQRPSLVDSNIDDPIMDFSEAVALPRFEPANVIRSLE